MRAVLLLYLAFCAVLPLLASAQEPLPRGIDRSDLPSTSVEPVGGQDLWSYILFIIAGLATVYFVFRGNKRA